MTSGAGGGRWPASHRAARARSGRCCSSAADRRWSSRPSTVVATEFTVDELARDAQLPVRTIREYQTLRLLPPPRRRGRVGVYGQEHAQRLAVIARLQRRGYSLAAIRDLLEARAEGTGLAALLGIDAGSAALDETPLRLTRTQLRARLPGLTTAALRHARAVGLVVPDGRQHFIVRRPARARSAATRLACPAMLAASASCSGTEAGGWRPGSPCPGFGAAGGWAGTSLRNDPERSGAPFRNGTRSSSMRAGRSARPRSTSGVPRSATRTRRPMRPGRRRIPCTSRRGPCAARNCAALLTVTTAPRGLATAGSPALPARGTSCAPLPG